MLIRVERKEFKASLMSAAKDHPMFFINGIRVQRSHNESSIMLISTNSQVLSVVKINNIDQEVVDFDPFVMSYNQVVAAMANDDDHFIIDVPSKRTGRKLREVLCEAHPSCLKVADQELGRDLKWERIIPDRISGQPGSYSSKYLKLAYRFCKKLNTDYAFYQNGEKDAGVVVAGDRGVMAIMPIKVNAPDYEMPSWLKSSLT